MSKLQIAEEECKNQNQLIELWEKYEGCMDCEYTKKVWNADELIMMSRNIADEMRKCGFEKGDIVAVLLSNTIAFPVVLMALLYVECNPLLLHVSTPRTEFERLTEKIPIKYFIHDFMKDISRFELYEEDTIWNWKLGNIKIKAGRTRSLSNKNFPQWQGVVLHPTSGTFGEPGICVRNQEVAVAEAVNYVSTIDIYNRARIMITTPLSHAFAYGFGLISAILTHSELVISPAFNPKKILRSLSCKACDILTIVPPMTRVLMLLKESNPKFRMAKSVFYAGAPCDDAIVKSFESIFDTTLYAIYGSTETGAIASNYAADAKLPGVGRILKNVCVSLKKMEEYKDFGSNIGEVNVKSTSMMQGYYSLKNEGLFENGFFSTGDIGTWEEESLTLKGRIKDIINVDGLKVDPREIENLLLENPDVQDAVVYAAKLDNMSDIIQCAICVKGSVTNKDTLRQYCMKNLSFYKVPRIFHILSELPRTASGKCIKTMLPGYVPRERSL